ASNFFILSSLIPVSFQKMHKKLPDMLAFKAKFINCYQRHGSIYKWHRLFAVMSLKLRAVA
ncbi:MAG: hypothetical protein PHD82_09830, partial [Candidatus Riflebacteria bacterium]|nr:hypothetical protein [Candidatus Riflebacteria bacterium]